MAGHQRWNPWDSSGATRALLALACLAWCAPAAEPAPEGVAGRVVDPAGTGVAGVKVWVVGGAWDEPEAVAEATTDAHGAFSFPGLWDELARKRTPGSRSPFYGLAARDEGGRIGWLTNLVRGSNPPVKIELVEPGEARGRVVDTAGKPVAGAEVVPAVFIRSPARQSASDYARLPAALARALAATTAADGSFTLRGVPKGCRVQATVTARGFGAPRVSWGASAPVTIALDGRLGRIEGRLVTPDARPVPAGLSVHLRRRTPPGDVPGGAVALLYFRSDAVGGDGRFRFDDLPPGPYALSVEAAPDSAYTADPVAHVEVKPDAVVSGLSLPLRRLLAVTGRVTDATTGAGLPGVGLTAYLLSDNSLQYNGRAETDARGRYTVHVASGKVVIQPSAAPKTHLGLDRDTCPRFDVAADRDWPDFKLPRAAALDGVVVDGAGKPVEGAEVHLVKSDLMGFAGNGPPTRTAPDGSFRLEQLDPDDTLPVRARTKEATTDGAVVIRPGKQAGKLTLTIDPKTTSHVHGAVADRAGKAVAGAAVSLWWGRNYVSEKTQFSGVGSVLESYTTDAAGRFASSALWPGDRYKVTVEASGYGKAESAEITARAGDDHDFGTIRLVGSNAGVAGRVVDTAGKPLADVTVFNHGDGPEAVSTRTDAGGRFRLEGLFAGGKYVFARKDGFRFTGARVEGDSRDLTLTLRGSGEPPPPWKPAEPATPAEETAVARRVLTKLWDRYGKDATKNGAFVCILQMARIDPALALKWSAETGGRYNGRVNQEAAETLAENDADGAVELLTAPGAGSSYYALQKLAERFADEDRDKALQFAEEAAVQARALEQPNRTSALAKVGEVLVRLGRKDAGRALVNEAADAAARMGTDGLEAYARGTTAGALAPFDADRALTLVEPIKGENDRDRYLGFVASALAATDPARALALADKIGGRSSAPQSVKVAIAYALGGAGRTDEAVRVIEGMTGYAAEKYRGAAFGWLAVAVAPRDPARAATFIDRALAGPVDRPEDFRSWTYFGGGAGAAAWAVACAQRAGYPDMAGAVARVLAARPSNKNGDPSMEAQSQAIAAAVLALTDPGAARQMLRDVETRAGLGPADLGRVADRRWLVAWALADPRHAEELFDAGLAALEGQRDVNLQSTGLLKLSEVLVQPRNRREPFLRREVGATWYPGADN